VITHIVLFKMEPDAAAEARDRLNALAGKVPSLRSMKAGVDILHTERSYDLAVLATFDDRAGLEAYVEHPDHQLVVAFIRERATASAAVDYES
jgi:hypothetical protein